MRHCGDMPFMLFVVYLRESARSAGEQAVNIEALNLREHASALADAAAISKNSTGA